VAPCFKNLLRLEAGYPALRCHNLKQNTGHTHNTHNTGAIIQNKTQVTRTTYTTQEPPHHRTHERNTKPLSSGGGGGTHPSDLKKYRRGLVSSELLSETEIIFLLEQKPSKQLQSGVRSRRTSCTRSSSSRFKGTRRRRLSHLQQLAAGGPAARAAPAAVR